MTPHPIGDRPMTAAERQRRYLAKLATRLHNDGYTHEALHTTYVLMETFSRHVLESRCAEEFDDVKLAAERVQSAMGDLYQLIGGKMKAD